MCADIAEGEEAGMTLDGPDKGRIPVWFSLLFVGQVAGFLFTAGMQVATSSLTSSISLIAPATLVATALWAPAYLLFVLLSSLRLARPLASVVAALTVFATFYVLMSDIIYPSKAETLGDRLSEALAHPIQSLIVLVPMVAVPSGLLFHFLISHVRLAQSFSSKDRFIALTWGGELAGTWSGPRSW